MTKSETREPRKRYLKNFWKYRFLLMEIVRKNIKLQYRNSFLGVFWTFLQPLMTTLVLVAVFKGIFGRSLDGTVNYPIYLLCGRLIYECFSQSTKRGMRSVTCAADIIKKVYVPKYIYPLGNMAANFITFLISLLVLVAFMAYYMLFTDSALRLSRYILLAWVPLLILFVLCVGVGMILSVLQVFFKDIEYLYEVFCMLLFYLTPIFYMVKQLNAGTAVQYALLANPLYSIVSMFRSCVLFGEMWNWNWFWYSSGVSIFLLAVGVLIFYRKQDKFILHI